MEKRFIAVDAGKYNTKVCAYNTEDSTILKTKFRTKIGEGTFDDDMFERGTYIVQVDGGPVYKVGRDGRQEPDLETSKKSEIHRICTMAGIAMACGNGQHENLHVVVGIPLQICNIPEERLSYKNYILGNPGEKHLVRIKTNCNGPIYETSFSFEKELVYPEGIGVLYEYPAKLDGTTGIIDIGNLNTNNLYCDQFLIDQDYCFTDELGGKVMISKLAQVLTSELGARVNENIVASALLRPLEERHLRSSNGNKALEEKSAELISKYLLEHARAIKQKCDTRHWPMDFMNIVCMGGTSRLLKNELHEVFGSEVFIPDEPEYVNACGFLKKMCADAGVDITRNGGSRKGGDAS